MFLIYIYLGDEGVSISVRLGFLVSWLGVAKKIYRDSASFAFAVVLPLSIVAWLLVRAYIGGGWEAIWSLLSGRDGLAAAAVIVLLLVIPLIPLAVAWLASLAGRGSYGYLVEDRRIRLFIMKAYTVPLEEAEIRLVPLKEVKPLPIKHGVHLSGFDAQGLHIGYTILADGNSGHVFIYEPGDKAILIQYRGKRFVIAHPGVEKVYEKLLQLQSPRPAKEISRA